MTIEKRLERIEAILDARGLDWDHPRVEEEPAKEPPKKWRILEPGEVVCSSDWICARSNLPSDPPDGLGWRPVDASVGTSVCEGDPCIFARPVADEPAKEPEPEHPAGPKPDPGEGHRILSKDPLEDLKGGDEFWFQAKWYRSAWSDAYIKNQEKSLWYRRKIEQPKPAWEPKVGDWVRVTKPQKQDRGDDPIWLTTMDQYDGKVFQVKELIRLYQWPSVMCDGINCAFKIDWLSPAEPPEPEYREPVLPADCGRICEFSSDGKDWTEAKLQGYAGCFWISVSSEAAAPKIWDHARIKVDA